MANPDPSHRVAEIGAGYRSRAWLAMVLLLAFLALYLLLASWFTWTTYRMLSGLFAGGGGAAAGFLSAIPALFLAVFMWKALFFVRVGGSDNRVEITAAGQPRLFNFIHQLADEVGAPKPHKVFVTPVVNASVFYDLSVLNFLLPSKKNLTIGLGLINSLDRSEFRAVLAHEFGHFAQKTMSVGRWVYMGSQIAEHIVSKRDWLDRGLDWLSRIDLRLAWIGWIMRTVVWSIRSLTETVFGFVVMAQRALSREMEFEADLVAVSATGSDALIHALHKLQVADEDWNQALDFADQMLWQQKMVPDPYAIQTAITEHLRSVLHQPDRGKSPVVPTSNASEFRVFSEKLAQPPKMWATHPPNNEREENAKRNYIAATLDPTPAWSLFDNIEELKAAVTATMVAEVVKGRPELKSMTKEESLEELARLYRRNHFDPSFQGAYRDRPVMTAFAAADEALGSLPAREEIATELHSLYPESLREKLEQWRNLSEDVLLLESIESGVMDAPTGIVRHRGQDYKLSALSTLIENVTRERDQMRALIDVDDQKCRAAHHAAARYVARGWQDYHGSLVKMLHYAEHSLAELVDAKRFATNLFHMSIAAGRPSERRIKKIMNAMNELHAVMTSLHAHKSDLKVSPNVLKKLEVGSWGESLEAFKLPPANRQNLQQWLEVIDSWYSELHDRYEKLRDETLDDLLAAEAQISEYYLSGQEADVAPDLVVAPDNYATRVRGTERDLQKRLDWWSRFTLADGRGPAILRFAVAASIVGGVIWLGTIAGNATVMVCNGLAIPVNVSIEGKEVSVGPRQHRKFSPGSLRHGLIRTTTRDGDLIEQFEADLGLSYATYIYNVASAVPLTRWEVGYGNAQPDPPVDLGAPRWTTSNASHIFEEPPRQIKIEGKGATRTVLSHHAKLHPRQMLAYFADDPQREQAVRMHAMWDSGNSRWLDQWLGLAMQQSDDIAEIVDHRLAINPDDTFSVLVRLKLAEGAEKDDLRKQIRRRAKENPGHAELNYMAVATYDAGPERDSMYVQGSGKFPDSKGFRYAASMVQARQGKFREAEQGLTEILSSSGPWFSQVSLSCARLRRLLADKRSDVNYGGLQDSVDVSMLRMLEDSNPDGERSAYAAFALIDRGELEQAQKRAAGSDIESAISVLLGTSLDATDRWQQAALAVPLEELSQEKKLYLAALCARLGKPYDNYLESYSETDPSTRYSAADALREILADRWGHDSSELLEGLNPDERGYVMAAAVVYAPQKVPATWKRDARRLLFCTERPWLGAVD